MTDNTKPEQEMEAQSATIDPERLAAVMAVPLQSGSHSKNDELQMCVMEAAAYVAGEPWSDAPQCACRVITAFMVSWNDALPSDADRDRLLKTLLPLIVGTRSTPATEKRRSYMALDWLIRVHTPKWLELSAELESHAIALRSLDEIVDLAGAIAAGELMRAARDAAAMSTVWSAAAWDAAAGAAAGAAARDAAAMSTVWSAAACDAAAWAAAAGAAAGAALNPTTEWLQESASDLVRRMCALHAEEAAQNGGAA